MLDRSLFICILHILKFAKATDFVKYQIYQNTDINDNYKKVLRVESSFVLNKDSAELFCLYRCNLNLNCYLAALDFNTNNCTMYNNQTTLMNTVQKANTVLYSKNELESCSSDYYQDTTTNACKSKKSYNAICNSTIECYESDGLQCLNGKCTCSISPIRLIFF